MLSVGDSLPYFVTVCGGGRGILIDAKLSNAAIGTGVYGPGTMGMVLDRIVVVGGGQAGGKAVLELRRLGFDGAIELIGAETHIPYERPPLSKSYLAGEPYRSHNLLPSETWYAEQQITMRLGTRAIGLERDQRQVVLEDGVRVDYDRVLLATGLRARRLAIPGAQLPGVHYLRTLEDSRYLGGRLRPGTRLVIVGAGWIGLEVAAVAAEKGCAVTVVDPHQVAVEPVLGTVIGEFFVDVHRAHGVEFVFGYRVMAVRGTASVSGVVLDDGQELPADEVVAGIGALPETEPFDSGLLAADGGVPVDPQMRTVDPHVFAAGDIAAIQNPLYGAPLRSEHWTTALASGRTAAHSMLDLDTAFDPVPFIFTDQYDLFVEYVGWLDSNSAADLVIRGDLHRRAFQAFWLEGNRVVAAMHVNCRDEGVKPLQALIRRREPVNRARLADPSVPLADLLA